jgi:hypothetical protein
MAKANSYNITGDHVVDEIVEHIVMEKSGAIHEHITAIKPKAKKKSSGFFFNLFIYGVVALELWLIYLEILKLV